MTKQQKTQLVERLVSEELQGSQDGREAGEQCAMNNLTVAGFETVIALNSPTFKALNAAIRNRGETKLEQEMFWRQLVGGDECRIRVVTAHPDFAPAFVQRVREVWEQVREDVLAEVAACPGRDLTDEPEPEGEAPTRPTRQRPNGRRGSSRGARGRFGRGG